jgi:hypothetical protein
MGNGLVLQRRGHASAPRSIPEVIEPALVASKDHRVLVVECEGSDSKLLGLTVVADKQKSAHLSMDFAGRHGCSQRRERMGKPRDGATAVGEFFQGRRPPPSPWREGALSAAARRR